MSEHDNDFREVIDEEEDKNADVVEVTGDTTVDPSVADPNNDKKDDYEDICYICRRPESVAGKMIHIPNNICICNDCMQKTFDSMEGFGFGSGDNASLNNIDFSKMPNISMVNLSDLSDFMPNMPNSQRLKKKKKKEDKQEAPVLDIKNIPPPHKIKAELDEYVVGQEYAKKVMSVAVYNHYKRVATGTMDEIEIEKSNMLMIGPTGSGKTYLVKILARLLDVPLAITDATSLTEAGYIGDDIESVVSKLLAAADNDVEKAERGIIFIDEIDKLAKKKNTNQRDVSGESVQQGMLKLLEGAEVEVPVGASSKNAMVPMTIVDTKNILFICGGAFPDLDSIIKERLNKASSMGFMADLKDKYDKEENILMKATVEDLKNFGMIPEFLGRLPILFSLEALDEDMLVRILKEPKNAIIKQYQKLLELDEVKLEFTDEALHAIAKQAKQRELGARALRAIIEEFMLDIMYEIPKDDNIGKVIITEDYVTKKGGPKIVMRGAEANLIEG
ncbi:ATP-dependent Clp protease ATP-binding subunit ClpX [Roseburia sp. NSJ-9]|jgi:ATP-dependent Clp protease ATP-binding subunit ClpX|uniref:ATP-dependent Clp protease ATP-binding subunit ClpX n=1 Tax=Roseburia lenta TaxID=2763061 RepID=A0ABR7GHT7_9FIRM|nr:ATP-dependent Clp protease ATP-binding subunit ClpX [Roseburia lenta]MBC5686853.1 ATP-dependent Clp protease ATP-binding subunit ClpX [Roseburia lenta]